MIAFCRVHQFPISAALNSLSGLACGAQVITASNFDGDEILSLLNDYHPTVLVMPPAALFALVRDHNARPDDFHSLRLCMSGGDKVSLQLEQEFSRLSGFYVEEGYGMSEFGMCTMNPLGKKLARIGRSTGSRI